MTEAQRAQKRFRREHRPKNSPSMDRALDSFERHAKDDTLRHFGTVVQTGHVISTRRIEGEKPQDHGMQGPRTLDQIQTACREIRGMMFKALPGNPPDDSVVGMLEDGSMVPATGVEMIWNDCNIINSIHGPGVYEEIVAGSNEEKILNLAKKLYAKKEPLQ
jgi:hypothetical protein